MRLQRGVAVAGLDPQLARSVVRACQGDLTRPELIAYRAKLDSLSANRALHLLEDCGFVRYVDADGRVGWVTTTAGNALAMASFNKPISRIKAQMLLAGMVERAAAYNDDDAHFLIVSRLRVFGSYLDPDVDPLGDVDVAVEFRDRTDDSLDADRYSQRAMAYAHASGRVFPTIIEELDWPRREVELTLRRRSAYINITRENVTRLTDRWETVYEAALDADGTST